MKVLILAGGLGTRLSEETKLIPKPMVEIGGKPILWHIMKIYSHYWFNEFIVCLWKFSNNAKTGGLMADKNKVRASNQKRLLRTNELNAGHFLQC